MLKIIRAYFRYRDLGMTHKQARLVAWELRKNV
jgi:hypothetical protein